MHRFLVLLFAAVVAASLAGAAMAQGRFSGIWEVTENGRQILWLDLAEADGTVTGVGTATDDFGPPGAANVRVVAGRAQGDMLTLVLDLEGTDGRLSVQLTAVPGIGGSDLVATLVTDRVIREGRMVWLEGPGTGRPMVCEQLENLTAEMNARAGTEMVQAMRGIYANHGLAFGGEETAAKCEGALDDLLALDDRTRGGAAAGPEVSAMGREEIRQLPVGGRWAPVLGERLSLWSHNGSLMAWESGPGDRRIVWYWEPRAGLSSVGVRQGVLLFEGRRVGNRMEGTARIYTPGCGAFAYPVEGPIDASNAGVTMTGNRPVVDAACRITGERPDTLRFDYVADAPVDGSFEEGPIEGDVPGFGVWADRFSVRGIAANDTLNLRAGPGTSYRILGELPPGASGILMEIGACQPEIDQLAYEQAGQAARTRMIEGRWCNVSWGQMTGWVYGSYLRSDGP